MFGLNLEWVTWISGSAPTLDRWSVKEAVRTHFSNNGKAERILGYEPKVGLAEGVRLSCEGYKKYLAAEATKKEETKKSR